MGNKTRFKPALIGLHSFKNLKNRALQHLFDIIITLVVLEYSHHKSRLHDEFVNYRFAANGSYFYPGEGVHSMQAFAGDFKTTEIGDPDGPSLPKAINDGRNRHLVPNFSLPETVFQPSSSSHAAS